MVRYIHLEAKSRNNVENQLGFMPSIVILAFVALLIVVFFCLLLLCLEYLSSAEGNRGSTGSHSQLNSRNESGEGPLDLHGYLADFALTRLEQYLDARKEAGQYFAIVTTGRGLQTSKHRVKLRTAVKDWLDKKEYSYEVHDGDFKVYLKNRMFVNRRKQAQNKHFNFY